MKVPENAWELATLIREVLIAHHELVAEALEADPLARDASTARSVADNLVQYTRDARRDVERVLERVCRNRQPTPAATDQADRRA